MSALGKKLNLTKRVTHNVVGITALVLGYFKGPEFR